MWIRSFLIAAFSVCLSIEALPASAQSIDLNARIDVGLPSVAVVVGGEREYFRRSPGWGYGRNKRGWYRLDPQPGGFVVFGGRQYYKESPGWGYRRNPYGWYKLPTHASGYVTLGGRQYYERSPGDGYRQNRNGWYRHGPKMGKKQWRGRGGERGKKGGYGNNGNGRGRGNGSKGHGGGGGHGKGHGRH